MFVRLVSVVDGRQMEVLVNTAHISRIEVHYQNQGWECDPRLAVNNPDCTRVYKVFVGADTYLLAANPDSKVVRIFEEIYKNAVADTELTDQAE